MAVYQYGDRIPTIGKNTYISDSARVIGDVVIQDNCYIGHGAIIHGRLIKTHAVIGIGAIIGFDVVVGAWAIVAEGSVIPQKTHIPDEKITGGVPYKIIGDVRQRHKDFWTYGKQLYVDLARDYPEKLKKLD